MEAVRCIRCGETRWSLFPGSLAESLAGACEVCGGPTVPERRRPGQGPDHLDVERRRAAMVDRITGTVAADESRLSAR